MGEISSRWVLSNGVRNTSCVCGKTSPKNSRKSCLFGELVETFFTVKTAVKVAKGPPEAAGEACGKGSAVAAGKSSAEDAGPKGTPENAAADHAANEAAGNVSAEDAGPKGPPEDAAADQAAGKAAGGSKDQSPAGTTEEKGNSDQEKAAESES